MSVTTTDEITVQPPADDAPSRSHPRHRGRRLGGIGVVAVLGLVAIGTYAFINFSRTTAPPRTCRGSGVSASATTSHPSAEAAIAAFASSPSVPRWQRSAMSLPPDRWLRRNPNLYENSIDSDRLLMLDIGQTDSGWSVSGVWVCEPADA